MKSFEDEKQRSSTISFLETAEASEINDLKRMVGDREVENETLKHKIAQLECELENKVGFIS